MAETLYRYIAAPSGATKRKAVRQEVQVSGASSIQGSGNQIFTYASLPPSYQHTYKSTKRALADRKNQSRYLDQSAGVDEPVELNTYYSGIIGSVVDNLQNTCSFRFECAIDFREFWASYWHAVNSSATAYSGAVSTTYLHQLDKLRYLRSRVDLWLKNYTNQTTELDVWAMYPKKDLVIETDGVAYPVSYSQFWDWSGTSQFNNAVWDQNPSRIDSFEPNYNAVDKHLFDSTPYDNEYYTKHFNIKHVAHKFIVPGEQYHINYGLPKPFSKSVYDVGFAGSTNVTVANWDPVNQYLAFLDVPVYLIRTRGAMTHDEKGPFQDNQNLGVMFGSHSLHYIKKRNVVYDCLRYTPFDGTAKSSNADQNDAPFSVCPVDDEYNRGAFGTTTEQNIHTT